MTLLIKNVRVVRGTGDPAEWLDVFIHGGAISAVGNFPAKPADRTIDGNGCYLVPGFIDVHTESDHYFSLLDHPAQEDFLKQGVTTIVGGQEGVSLAPLLYGTLESLEEWTNGVQANVNWHTLREFFSVLNKRGLGVNFATFAGHTTIRRALAGETGRELTPNELSVFSRIVEDSLSAGAYGVSTGLKSVYGRNVSYAEIKLLASLVGRRGAVYSSSLRKAKGLEESVDEIMRVMKDCSVKTVISNFLPVRGQGKEYERALEKIEGLPRDYELRFDVSPFSTSIRPLYRFLPDWAQSGSLAEMWENLADPWKRERIIREFDVPNPDDFMVAKAIDNDPLVGYTLSQVMELYGLKQPADALLRLMLTCRLRALILYRNVDGGLLSRAVCHPRSFIASKGACVAAASIRDRLLTSDASTSTFPRYLSFVCREKLMSFEAAVSKITREAAQFYGFAGRGEIKEGYAADLAGIDMRNDVARVLFVVVNGRVAVENGHVAGPAAGEVLRRVNV